jgi:hypothetical protein
MRRCSVSSACLDTVSPGGVSPSPDTPDAAWIITSHMLRQHLAVNPERVRCSGFILCRAPFALAQTCLEVQAESEIGLGSGDARERPLEAVKPRYTTGSGSLPGL